MPIMRGLEVCQRIVEHDNKAFGMANFVTEFKAKLQPFDTHFSIYPFLTCDHCCCYFHGKAMYTMYEDVPLGGIVIFDDVMSHPPVKRFWTDFKTDQNLPEELNRIDTHSAWFRKRVSTKIDQSKKRPPRDVNT